jgi:two-component system response regulator (stage 0 sporulation protein A)
MKKEGYRTMHTIIICDDNANSLEGLSLTIEKEPQFKIVAQAYDGKTAISLIERHRPDIIILDIVMPEYDGVYIVNYIRKSMKKYVPIIYILSGLGTDSIIRAFNELGVDFYSMKPVSMSVVVRNLDALVRQRENEEINTARVPVEDGMKDDFLEDAVKNTLLHLGIMPHRISSKCITDALLLYICNAGSNPMLTKDIYPEIAKKYGLSNSSVEKNIRDTIAQIQKKKTEMYSEIFFYSTNLHITNGEFLSVMSDYICKCLKNRRYSEVNRYES